jgi:hypothetical protein
MGQFFAMMDCTVILDIANIPVVRTLLAPMIIDVEMDCIVHGQ